MINTRRTFGYGATQKIIKTKENLTGGANDSTIVHMTKSDKSTTTTTGKKGSVTTTKTLPTSSFKTKSVKIGLYRDLKNPHKPKSSSLELNNNCSIPGTNNQYCLKYDFKRLISPDWTCDSHVTVLMMVMSVPANRSRRNLLRRTWCSNLDDVMVNGKIGNMKHIFVVGRTNSVQEQLKLEEEASVYGDILQDDFVESYRNMILKTILAFRWFNKHCKNVPFLMKTDDDMFIDSYNLVKSLLSKSDLSQNALFGMCYPYGTVVRKPEHRWYVSKLQFDGDFYPKYCAGTGYVIGSELAHKVAQIIPDVPLFPIEDAYIGLCVNYLKGRILNKYGFSIERSDCSLNELNDLIKRNALITLHKAGDELVDKLWRIVNSKNKH